MLLRLAKIYNLRSERLIREAREAVTMQHFVASVTQFLPGFKKFINEADEDQQIKLEEIFKEIKDYVQTVIGSDAAARQENLADLDRGFDAQERIAETILAYKEQLLAEDPEALLDLSGDDEVDVGQDIESIVDTGRAIFTDLMAKFKEGIEKLKAEQPELFTDEPQEMDQDSEEIQQMTGYRSMTDEDNIEMDMRKRKARAKYKAYSMLDGKFRAQMAKWKHTYYVNTFKNGPKWEKYVSEKKDFHRKRLDHWKLWEAMKMTPEELEKLRKTNIEKYKKVVNDRVRAEAMKVNKPEEFEKLESDWAQVDKNKKVDQKTDKEKARTKKITNDRADKRREDRLNKLLKMVNRY